MNLRNLSDAALLSQTRNYVSREREMTIHVLHHLKEVERRRLFASQGYSSLFDYVTRELGYCAASACRRIDAMRLLKELPQLEEKIQNGNLTLSTVARAQSFFKKEPVTREQKAQVMGSLENKTTREVERELLSRSSVSENHLKERVKAVTSQVSEMKIYVSDEVLNDLEKLKGLLAHSHPEITIAELVGYLAKLGLNQHDLAAHKRKATSAPSIKVSSQHKMAPQKDASSEKELSLQSPATPAPNESARQAARSRTLKSRYIPRPIVRAVWRRDQSRCTWVSQKTGQKCGSMYRLQVDHIKAYALGGASRFENLRLLCFHHNQLEAEKLFGKRQGRRLSQA